jgi:hypothetical protein
MCQPEGTWTSVNGSSRRQPSILQRVRPAAWLRALAGVLFVASVLIALLIPVFCRAERDL